MLKKLSTLTLAALLTFPGLGAAGESGVSKAELEQKIEELSREVRAHNNFAQRVPVLEEQMKVANHRIADLEANEHTRERN